MQRLITDQHQNQTIVPLFPIQIIILSIIMQVLGSNWTTFCHSNLATLSVVLHNNNLDVQHQKSDFVQLHIPCQMKVIHGRAWIYQYLCVLSCFTMPDI